MSMCKCGFGLILTAMFCASLTLTLSARAQNNSAAPPAEKVKLSPSELDKLLAPIALYPDALIIQIVTCAGSPYQVKQVHEWLKAHPELKGTAVQDGATDEGFDASFVAIVLFPQVVQMMADQPEWTKQMGEAFANDRSGVFASIQRLRTQAQQVGNLNTNEQQSVETVTTSGGQNVIVIEPANPQIVYVPQYDPQVVYVQTLPTTTTVVVDDDDDGDVLAAGVIGFTAGVFLGAALDNDYYHCGGWGYHGAYMCDEGWDDFYDHREDMANDFYDHREEMSEQRGKNQENRQEGRTDRQDTRSENQSGRQDSRSENQSGRQDNRSENQAGREEGRGERQDTRSQDQSGRQDNRSQNQAGRQDGRTGDQSTRQNTRQDSAGNRQTSASSDRASKSSRGSTTNRAQPSTGTNSSAFSGYQKGSNERASSSRGKSSVSKSSSSSKSRSASSGSKSSGSRSSGGASRSGGGGSRGGGGGGRGGGGRR